MIDTNIHVCPDLNEGINVQAKSASRRQWRNWIGAAQLESAKVHGKILFNKWFFLDTLDSVDTHPENTQKASAKTWTIQKLFSAWRIVAFSGTVRVDQWVDESNYLVDISRVKFMEAHTWVPRPATSDPIPVYPQRYIAAGPQFSLRNLEVMKVPMRCFLQTSSGPQVLFSLSVVPRFLVSPIF